MCLCVSVRVHLLTMTLQTWMERMGGALKNMNGQDRRGSELQLCWKEASEVHFELFSIISGSSSFAVVLLDVQIFLFVEK